MVQYYTMGLDSLDLGPSSHYLETLHSDLRVHGIPERYRAVYQRMLQADYKLILGPHEIRPQRPGEYLTTVGIGEPILFLKNLKRYEDLVLQSSHPFIEWYQYRLLPREIRLRGREYIKHIGATGSAFDVFEGIRAHCPSGERDYPEMRIEALCASLVDPIIESYPTAPTVVGPLNLPGKNISIQIQTPSHLLKHMQDSPFEMRVTIGEMDVFIDRLHNARFLPMGPDGVLLSSIQVPDYVHPRFCEGRSEHDWSENYLLETKHGYWIINQLVHSLPMQELLRDARVSINEFKSKPVYYLKKFRQVFEKTIEENSDSVYSNTELICALQAYLGFSRSLLVSVRENCRELFRQYCIDDVVSMIQDLRRGTQSHSEQESLIHSLHSSLNQLHQLCPTIPENMQLLVGDLKKTLDSKIAQHGLYILDTIFGDCGVELEALSEYELRRENLQMLNKPYRGKGSPSERISVTTFIQIMYELGYESLYIHSRENIWPGHRELLMDEKLSLHKERLIDFVLELASSAEALVTPVHHGVYYSIDLKPIVNYLRTQSKYPSVSI